MPQLDTSVGELSFKGCLHFLILHRFLKFGFVDVFVVRLKVVKSLLFDQPGKFALDSVQHLSDRSLS